MEENKRLILEKNLLNVFEKYGDLQIKYNKDDKHYIDIKIGSLAKPCVEKSV